MVLQTITKEQAHLHIDPDKISYEIVRHGYDPRILHMISLFFFVLVYAQKLEQNLFWVSLHLQLHWCQPPLSFCRNTTWTQKFNHHAARFLVCYFPAIISETVAPNGSVRSRVRGFNNNTSLVEPVHRQNYLLCKIFDKTINAAM